MAQAKSASHLLRIPHRDYWLQQIYGLAAPHTKLCFQEPWIPYWFINGMHVLKLTKIARFSFLSECCVRYILKRKPPIGYSSAPQEHGHIVLGYVSINTIALSGLPFAFESINRTELYHWILSLKRANGCFESEPGCEADARSTYCAISILSMLNMLTPELTAGVPEFLKSCQGYDGGFGPIPGIESHGGYGFCAVAALSLLDKLDMIDVNAAIKWCAMRQMQFSGGFNGRTNKLVDTCYTWWVGAMSRILADHAQIPPFWNDKGLATYVLGVCQTNNGGVCDKPGAKVDMFHTMYSLVGLSAASREYVGAETGVVMEEMDARHCVTKVAAAGIKEYFEKIPFVIPSGEEKETPDS
jgi:protein farnesyltransferase subunit beta